VVANEVVQSMAVYDPAASKSWAAADAEFDRLSERACKVFEDASWISLNTGVRIYGGGRGLATAFCRQRFLTFRGTLAKAALTGASETATFLKSSADTYAAALSQHEEILKKLVSYEVNPPKAPGELPEGRRMVGRAEWTSLHKRVLDLYSSVPKLAAAHCAIPGHGLVDGCSQVVSSALKSLLLVPFHE